MLAVCRRYSQLASDPLGQDVPTELQRVAEDVVRLQEARHNADYNIKDVMPLAEALGFVQLARAAFADWVVAASDPAADVFLTELLVGGVKDR